VFGCSFLTSFFLKMASAVYVEILWMLQYMMFLNTETQRYTLNSVNICSCGSLICSKPSLNWLQLIQMSDNLDQNMKNAVHS
jgi:hypothetical protein